MSKNKKGMTLVELIVAVAILGLGMAAFTLLSMRAWNYKSYVLEQSTSTAAAQRVLSKMVNELRSVRQASDGSYAIKEIKNDSLTVYREEDTDGKAERVRYFIEDGKLKKGVTKFIGGTYSDANETVEVLLNWVTNMDLSKPLFQYYDNRYPINEDDPMLNLIASDARLVRIHLWVNIRPIVAPENVNLESVVEFRNLNEM